MSDSKDFLKKQAFRQFVKFCIVGASSFAIDFGISYVLHYKFNVTIYVAKTISFVLAVTNGFIWNRIWTFRAQGQRSHREQYAMFFAVNIVGYVLNLSISTLVMGLEAGRYTNLHPSKLAFVIATLSATSIVVFWNFFANRHWTFKQPQPAQPI